MGEPQPVNICRKTSLPTASQLESMGEQAHSKICRKSSLPTSSQLESMGDIDAFIQNVSCERAKNNFKQPASSWTEICK